MMRSRSTIGSGFVAALLIAAGCGDGTNGSPGTGGKGGAGGGQTAGTAGGGTSGGTAGTGGSIGGTSGGGTGGTSAGGSGDTSAGGTSGSGTGGTNAGGTSGGGTGGTSTGGTGGGGTGGTSAGGSGGGGTGGTGCTTHVIPPTLNVPAGAALKFHLHAMGDQIYTCTPSSTGGAGGSGAGGAGGSGTTTYSFVLKQPDAKLYDQTNTQVATHGAGPNWTSTVDNSVVVGAKVFQENSPLSDAIPWLLLRATMNSGTGAFSDVTFVQRLNTTGGKAPATGCDATTANTDTRVSYTADYYFYSGGSGAAWTTPPANLPAAIAVPSGAAFKLHDHAIGAQVYTCTPSAAGGAGGGGTGGAGGSGATTYSWVLKQPEAVLYDVAFAQVGTHGLGPNWTSTVDGSVVNGAKVA